MPYSAAERLGQNMDVNYPHLFSPLTCGNMVFQSRMYTSTSHPHFAQGPEPYPSENLFRHYINKARQGAAYVIVSGNMVLEAPVRIRGRHPKTMEGHFPNYDIEDSTVQHYMSQLADAIHFYGAKASIMIGPRDHEGYDVDDGAMPFVVMGDGGGAGFVNNPGKRISESQLIKIADNIAHQAVMVQDCGYDMVYMHSAYRLMLPGRFLSLRTNTRDDEFGGSLENRARFHIMIADKIKERCGKDFLIEFSITGEDLEEPGKEWTTQDTANFAKLMEGHVDILQIRPHSVEHVHNMGFTLNPTPCLHAAEAAKKSGAKVIISSVSGFCDPELAEQALIEGKVDLLGMARSFISNPDWGKLARAGRREDIVPCIKCNKCHRNTYLEPPLAVCSVNPTWSQEQRVDFLVKPPEKSLKIAIVGGGPAGMRSALFAVERGHRVTLFEKTGALGGQLKINEFADFKWPMRDYGNWLISHVENNPDIEVRLNTEATKELLQLGDYDEIFTAIGAEPIIPPIPGADGKNVMHAADVYGNEHRVGEKVVIIGGGDVGVETGLHLTRGEREVFVIEMREDLMIDATPIHYRARVLEEWEKDENFAFACNATCTEITDKGVSYKDKDGQEHYLEADTVILAAGYRPKRQEALDFYWLGKRIHLMGDCSKVGSLQTCNRDAFRTAMTV